MPWEVNIVYNVELSGMALPVGVAALTAGLLVTGFWQRERPDGAPGAA